MDDQSGRWTARLDCHARGVADQGGGHARRHLPAHDSAREQVKYDRQVQPAGAGPDVRDIRDLSLDGRSRIELPGKHVRRNRQRMLAVCRVHELALPDWFQTCLLHQLTHLVTADLEAAISQRCD